MVRFRIKAEHVEDVFAMLADVKIEPIHVQDRGDGGVAIEIGEISDEQGQAIAAAFRPEWSAIIGIIGGVPPLERH
ncbi:hypothetical protein SPKIRA_11510 [Sphingomonas paucimobilis]|jgi:hypothetical protein|uniref:DUF4911 domain-containing protein n=2 Tax=Sphingomonas paucimobilis TaxID=13689 RepID=A0A411LH63_SPHPI|nr:MULTISPECIES: hypothetical protein [Sphingomonas]MBQ1481242.1 hypothetical protein [Sphingomonas sp.]MCM3677795.1 hypothetical protein [Sphingomonas paucimobilis]MDG5972424.1 hypothetical protein [Sphingomonas paucimobilis]NNG57600.1 hypothetical protein [Sphingomonas paucimobilis]QBE91671.1 hypothetical protein DRN02_006315 [Sphingomonas paucimobilis]